MPCEAWLPDNPFYNKNHSFESKLRMIEANSANPVYIYNEFKLLLIILPSAKTLAKSIKSNHSTVVSNIKNGELFRLGPCFAMHQEWYFSNLPYNISDSPLINKWPSHYFNTLIY